MSKIIYKYQGKGNQLSALLEGYLYALGEVCHVLYGPRGEVAMYEAIGSYFLAYMKEKMGITFSEMDPWERYCHIIEVFTKHGFYAHAELEELSENKYWMLETGQFAGEIWEEQKAWQRGTPPCPLWAAILHSLAEIDYSIVLDTVSFNEDSAGYESTFHFEKIAKPEQGVLDKARRELRHALLPICANCKKVRDGEGLWQDLEVYFYDHFETNFTHGICPDCAMELYPGLFGETVPESDIGHELRNSHILDRRKGLDRRSGSDRRNGVERRKAMPAGTGKVIELRSGSEERRSGKDRRSGIERRTGRERRTSQEQRVSLA